MMPWSKCIDGNRHEEEILSSNTRSCLGYPCSEEVYQCRCKKCGITWTDTASYMYDNK